MGHRRTRHLDSHGRRRLELLTKWLEWLKNLFFETDGPETKKKQKGKKSSMTTLILLAMIGAALMLAGQFITHKQSKAPASDTQVFSQKDTAKLSEVKSKVSKSSFSSIDEYEAYYDQNLKDILEQISGVSHVSVMVTFASSEKSIYQDNVKTQNNQTNETDKNGGKREVNEKSQDNEVVMVGEGDNKKPVVVGKEQPEVRGVLVVADGAENPSRQLWIMEAVSTVLDIPTYKVKVLPKS